MSDNGIKLVPLRDLPEESRLVVKCAADIKPEKIDWLWGERLPLGKCVLVAGEGGLGKSMVLAWIAATVSQGKEWPCGEGKSRRGSVVILSAEDDAADTIIPRLIAADADCTKVHILEAVRREGRRRASQLQSSAGPS
jgi:putative DNA primase/helicase